MNKATVQAGKIAITERMQNRRSVILFPNMADWSDEANELLQAMGSRPFVTNPYDGIYIRYSRNRCSLFTIRVDTLIVVEPVECDCEGLDIARRHLLRLASKALLFRVYKDGSFEGLET